MLTLVTMQADPRTESGIAAYRKYVQEAGDWARDGRARLAGGKPFAPLPEPPTADAPAFDVGNNGEWNVARNFNAMLVPLKTWAAKGVIAHFGDYNVQFGATGGYDHRIAFGPKCKALVQSLRTLRADASLPVYFLGVFPGSPIADAQRNAQIAALQNVPNCFIAKGSDNATEVVELIRHHAYGQQSAKSAEALAQIVAGTPNPESGTGFDPVQYGVPLRTKTSGIQEDGKSLCLAAIFSSHAVLQRDRPLPVWGRGTPGSKVTVRMGDKQAETVADAFGTWKVKLPAMPMNAQPVQMTISDTKQTIVLEDLLVGDVWLASGQSNMAFTLDQTLDGKQAVADSKTPLLRHVRVNSRFLREVPDDVVCDVRSDSAWCVSSPEHAGTFSAVAYFFGRKVVDTTGVPVGIITSALGGSHIEPWLSPSGIASVPELLPLAGEIKPFELTSPEYRAAWTQVFARIDGWIPCATQALDKKQMPPALPTRSVEIVATLTDFADKRASTLYNGQIHGLTSYPIAGVLWYQGESNGGEGQSYYKKMKALVSGWRSAWGLGEIPFYYVQLTNFQKPSGNPGDGTGWAYLREAQLQALDIPRTGMAVIIDIGEEKDIHPKNKRDVGERLARWALRHDYGKTGLETSGPLYQEALREGKTMRIRFAHAESGLMIGRKEGMAPVQELKDAALTQFVIAGKDRKFVPAQARIDGATVVVSADGVAEPEAVRYAFTMNPAGANLYNREGLPASPFRTDTWPRE